MSLSATALGRHETPAFDYDAPVGGGREFVRPAGLRRPSRFSDRYFSVSARSTHPATCSSEWIAAPPPPISSQRKRPVHPPSNLQQRLDRCAAAADQFAAAWLRAALQRRGVRVAGSAPSATFCSTSFK